MSNSTNRSASDRLLGRHGAAAVDYARRGWPVFPLGRKSKQPLTEHGVHDATTDLDQLRAWWTESPAANIGIATGTLVVIDIDGSEGRSALADLEDEHAPLPPTLRATTGRGSHLYFLPPPGASLTNSVGRLGNGLDTRADGGYVVAPPSIHPGGRRYRWTSHEPPAPLPAWVLDRLTPRPAQLRRAPLPRALGDDRSARYLAAALQGECETVATAAEGTRNDALNRAAFRLGQLSAAIARQHDAADDAEIEAALLDAADAAGLGGREAIATVASGLRAGHEHPRPLPHSTTRR